jgi:sec-independent protein translocase protein TatB
MFDIGWGELVVIGIIALIVIGPKELPTVLRTRGQTMAKVKRMANEFQGQFQEALREAELTDLKKHAEDLTSDISSSMDEFTNFDPMADTKEAIEHSFDSVPNTEAVTEAASPVAAEIAKSEGSEASTSEAATEAATPAAEAASEVPLPQVPAPVAHEDFAAAEPPAKPAGGSA